MRIRGQVRNFLVSFFALAVCIGACQAQTWPQRPVRLIVPFAPGGTTDALGRVFAHALGDRLGQQVVV